MFSLMEYSFDIHKNNNYLIKTLLTQKYFTYSIEITDLWFSENVNLYFRNVWVYSKFLLLLNTYFLELYTVSAEIRNKVSQDFLLFSADNTQSEFPSKWIES